MIRKIILPYLAFFYCSQFLNSQSVVNAYAKVTTINGTRTTLTVSNVNEANHTFAVNEQVIVMQMQDDCIGTNTTNASGFGNLASIANAGTYEIRRISSRSPASGTPTSITLDAALVNTFNTGANSSVQLITLRNLGSNYTTTANILGLAWNGNTGGVIAIAVINTLTLNHSIIADGLGFRGGSASNNFAGPQCVAANVTMYALNNADVGWKGEGIYKSTNAAFNNGRARILSGGGGGGHHNAGGGGGSNYSSGGQGGNGYNNCTTNPTGGLGGVTLASHISASRVFMGGGGGGAQQNDGRGTAGGDGGGIILIKANTLASSTTCTATLRISANGISGNNSPNVSNDGAGGGGAAGSIIFEVSTYSLNASCPVTIASNGGDGGDDTNYSGGAVGGGGGGAQGALVFRAAAPTLPLATVQTINGLPGIDNNSGQITGTAGGGTNNSGILSNSSGPLPIELLDFKARCSGHNSLFLAWETASETSNDYFTIEKSKDGVEWLISGSVKGAGTSLKQNAYSFEDYYNYLLEKEIIYYRLKQTDFDGRYKHSKIISMNCDLNDHAIIFYPNPAKTEINMEGSGIELIKIYDCLGQLRLTFIPERSVNKQTINIASLTDGLYTIITNHVDKTNSTFKFVRN